MLVNVRLTFMFLKATRMRKLFPNADLFAKLLSEALDPPCSQYYVFLIVLSLQNVRREIERKSFP